MSDVFERMWENKWSFFGVFFIVISLSYLVLLALDFYPEPQTEAGNTAETKTATITESDADATVAAAGTSVLEEQLALESVAVEDTETITSESEVASPEAGIAAEMPVRIHVERLDREITVLNPTSRRIADLDAALLDGAVRHPDSATLSQEGNVFVLGHSSYLPNVFNRNFQIFNGIQDLEWGDTITVYSDSHAYEYRVERVYRARAQDVTVPIAGTGNMLTLATCNSFGSVDDRYIVEAKQMSKRVL